MNLIKTTISKMQDEALNYRGCQEREGKERDKVDGNTAELGGGEGHHFRWKRDEKKGKARKQRPLWGALCLKLPDSKPGMGLEATGTPPCRSL